MKITNSGPQTIQQLQVYFGLGDLVLSPDEYQRETVWNIQQKQLLIDTIFTGFDMPKFYLWKIDLSTLSNGYPDGDTKDYYKDLLSSKLLNNDDPNPYLFEVIDGQQRIRTFFEFMGIVPPNNKCYRGIWQQPFQTLEETPIAKGKYFSQLNPSQQIKFQQYSLAVVVLEDASIDEVRELFLRLQNGTPLNNQQKRDAFGSKIGYAAKDIASMPLFMKSVNFDNTYSNHNLIASQMLRLELAGSIESCTSQQLDKLYNTYKTATPSATIVDKTKQIVKLMGNIFPTKDPHLNQNFTLSIYWLLSQITINYDIDKADYPLIRDNFVKLNIKRIDALSRDFSKHDDADMQDLTLALSRGNLGADAIKTRHNIIGQFLFNNVKLKHKLNLDPKRLFTYEEKLLLYHIANGQCEMEDNGTKCGRKIDLIDSVVDHVIPHSKGGLTILSNGRIVHKDCNNARKAKVHFSPTKNCSLL